MKTGYIGTFVITWAQTEVDGLRAAPRQLLAVGATWRWTGEALRVDGPQSLLLLSGDPAGADLRRRAARTARRLVWQGRAEGHLPGAAATAGAEDAAFPGQGFVLTDGLRSFEATVIGVAGTGQGGAGQPADRLISFAGQMPPRDRDLWVVRTNLTGAPPAEEIANRAGVICFTPGTRIATPFGARPIEALMPGDAILTKDNGPQPVIWSGRRRLSGARLHALPHLRPIRFRAGAFGIGRPDPDLLVSPQHRMLVQGPAARALFNAHEVLVAAEDLVNDGSICVDARLAEVTYVHILLESHQIVWANGLETESFHPSATSLETIAPEQRAALLDVLPGLAQDPQIYGAYARRNLSASEAAILRYDAA